MGGVGGAVRGEDLAEREEGAKEGVAAGGGVSAPVEERVGEDGDVEGYLFLKQMS